MENKLSELFPIESIGPLIGGLLLWFALNYLFIAPSLIGPRLAEKYYVPACMAAVATGRQAHETEVANLKQAFEGRMKELAQGLQQQVQTGIGGFMGMLLGGRPGSAEFMQKHGDTVAGWTNSIAAMGAPAIQERLRGETRAFMTMLESRQQEVRKGVLYPAPARFCGCVVNEGMKERVDMATFTATLRLYSPPAIRRMADGTMLHEAKACGSPPFV